MLLLSVAAGIVVMCCLVLVPSSIVIGACVVRRCRKDAAENDEDDSEERSDDEGGIEMGKMNPLAAAKLATAELRVALAAAEASEARESARAAANLPAVDLRVALAAAEAREVRESTLRSDADATSARQAQRTKLQRRSQKKARLQTSNQAIFASTPVAIP